MPEKAPDKRITQEFAFYLERIREIREWLVVLRSEMRSEGGIYVHAIGMAISALAVVNGAILDIQAAYLKGVGNGRIRTG